MTSHKPSLSSRSGPACLPGSEQAKSHKAAEAYLWACRSELEALKPGNVHIHDDGHGMTVDDFHQSALLTAPILTDFSQPGGQRIRHAVRVTMEQVGCNTNLGIILLCTPLLSAFYRAETVDALPIRLKDILGSFSLPDTAAVFAAIAHANPGGLGQAPEHDIHSPPTLPLREAMGKAADRDNIARQYAHGFQDIFDTGIPAYRYAQSRHWSPARATAYVYITFLATRTDGHVLRQWGSQTAHDLTIQARQEMRVLETLKNNQDWPPSWKDFDRKLKQNQINPGSSADLTVTTLLTWRLQDMLQEM